MACLCGIVSCQETLDVACLPWACSHWHVENELCPVRKGCKRHVYCRHSADREVLHRQVQLNIVLSGSFERGMLTVQCRQTGLFTATLHLACRESVRFLFM